MIEGEEAMATNGKNLLSTEIILSIITEQLSQISRKKTGGSVEKLVCMCMY